MTINDIIQLTRNGYAIYAHILCQQGMTISEFSNYLPNPYDGGRYTLYITYIPIEIDEGQILFIAHHHDLSGHIDDGTALTYAEQFYGKQGEQLYNHIVADMGIIDVRRSYMSFYKCPAYNTIPCAQMNIMDVYNYITSSAAEETTKHLRSLSGDEAKIFKFYNFNFITPSGVFTYRDGKYLSTASGMMVIDIDDLSSAEEVEEKIKTLLDLPRIETIMLFRSPRGRGIKWIIPIVHNEGHTHKYYFNAVANYLLSYGIVVDPSGKDVARACFLPHDPQAYINKNYIL